MPLGAAVSEGSSGESINHFGALRIRVSGIGALRMTVYSLDEVRSKTLVPLVLGEKNRIIPTRLVNFMEQRVTFEFKTTEMMERFKVNRIIVFVKPIFTSYPGS